MTGQINNLLRLNLRFLIKIIFRTYDCEVDESFWITKEYFDLATEYFKEQQKGSESDFSSESDSDSQ